MQTEYQTLWNKCLAVIKDIVPEAAFNTWFKPIIPLSYEEDVYKRQICDGIVSYNDKIVFGG